MKKLNMFEELTKAFNDLPSLDCGTCWGDCCVSPTMTAPEFVYMMQEAQRLYSNEELIEFIKEPFIEHKIFAGNQHCRFQDMKTGRCQIYLGRAAACRLHGHKILKDFGDENLEMCPRNPGNQEALTKEHFQSFINVINKLNNDFKIYYKEPYFFYSLNLDSWIDFYLNPEIASERPALEIDSTFLSENLTFKVEQKHSQLTTLSGKLNTIEQMFYAIHDKDYDLALIKSESLLYDFPSVGSYYLVEAKQMIDILKAQISK